MLSKLAAFRTVPARSHRVLASTSARFLSSSDRVEVKIATPFETHRLESSPPETTTTSKDEIMGYFREMAVMRRMEIVCDNLYKGKMIRGFCHLYDGQEACCTGMEAGLAKGDSIITAYRDHCQMLKRGGNVTGIIAELLGRAGGHSRGKGGSMHFYSSKFNFYGGNGIVGAQIPVGTGVAFAHKYNEDGGLCVTMFGDGAANQGQLYEALNMAYLWKLPVIFCCENNHFGMGTSSERAAASTEYFKRGDVVPGLKIDGMDVFAVREGIKFAADYSRNGNGPMYIELDTYRYHGHSMSDPGSTYRTRDDVNEVRSSRDPIDHVRNLIVQLGFADIAELKAIEREVRKEVNDAVEAAKQQPQPPAEDLFDCVYKDNKVPIRSADSQTIAFS